MTWLISFILTSSLFANGGTAVRDLDGGRDTQAVVTADETEQFTQTYTLSPNGKVSVSNINGSITIESWERSEVKLEVTKIAESREALADVEIKVDSSAERLEIGTDYGNWNRRGERKPNYKMVEVEYRLTVPRAAVLDEIETVNGSVSVKDVTNYVKASAVNGAVSGTNLRGTAELSTVNGAVTADFDELQTGSLIELTTVNGSANLIIPSDANATVKAESVNGPIKNDFGLPVRKGKYVGRDLYGKIGSGEVKIKLESVNGELSITRKNDGKSPNPVTNLLPAKASDDGDEDGDNFDMNFDSGLSDLRRAAEGNLEIARQAIEQAAAVSGKDKIDAIKAIAESSAMREEVIAEIEKIKPEIARIDAEALRAAAEAGVLAGNSARLEGVRAEAMERVALMRRTPHMEEKNGSYAVEGTPSIRIETFNCPVFIRGWDKAEVKYSLSRVASELTQRPIETEVQQKSAKSVEMKVINKDDSIVSNRPGSPSQVRLEVFVPKKSNLTIKTNDEIRLEGVSGDIDLEGRNGPINIRDTDGKLSLRAVDGLVRVIGFTGEFESQTADGEMFLEGDFLKISSKLQDGTIVLTLPKPTDASVSANTGSVAGVGIDLVRQDAEPQMPGNYWRLGKGGRDFNFNMGAGKLIIRGMSGIKAS